MRLFQEKRYEEAVPPLSEAIRIGRARSVDFSLLASAQSISGDDLSAEKTMEEARKLYPRSVFVLARCAHLLHSNGKVGEAEKMLELAKGINPREANTWWTFLNEGSNAAAAKALKNDVDFKPLMDLRPLNAVYAVRAEREIRFPDEAKSFDFTKAK
jgi:Tfp pilus assembly protein PilF